MRQLRYSVAASLDGFIAGPNGEFDLFRRLAAAGLVDGVDVAVIPMLIGAGIPLLPPPSDRVSLQLRRHRLYATTGTLFVEYDVARE